jgi:hypothetical protein
MKSVILLFSMLLLLVLPAFAQDLQYVHSKSGDTLVVKDDIEFNGTNTLRNLMQSDSLAPATRVYMLKAAGIYSCVNNPATSSKYRTIIMGPTQNLKTSAGTAPPIISGSYATGVSTYGGMNVNKDLLIKNIDLEIGNSAGNNGGWAFFNFGGPNMRLQVDNCILEHTWWVWVGGPPGFESVYFTNDYIVNMTGHTCRRNGGVVDFNGTTKHQDTLLVENCTHVSVQGTLYKFRYGFVVDKALFNHNDFIDCAGYVVMNNGDQTNLSVTNNIFVNCQLQGYCPVLSSADVGEVDTDSLAMGLVNLRVDSTFTAGVQTHGVYVDKNVTYWDPSLSNIVSTLNAKPTDGSTKWVSQMITMNTRTTALFADKTHYPKLNNGTWISKLPAFKKTDVLFTTQLAVVKAYAIAAVDTGYATPMKSWRQSNNAEAQNYVFADWPIPIDLSYTDSDLLTAGTGGFPLGDLSWFPTQFASWKAQETAELAQIQNVLDSGKLTGVATTQEIPQKFQLQQNYPNPFNPSTVISYSIAKAGSVTLKVYNILGREVATLVNGYQAANTYQVNFNASGLASGVYIYELRSGSNVASGKMLLMK